MTSNNPPAQAFTYPIQLVADDDGGFVVRCRDLPEAITQGETAEHATQEAQDCLDEAVHGRMLRGADVPRPSRARKSEVMVPLPVSTALKLGIYRAMRDQCISKSDLARRLGVDEKEIRRTLDPRHPTKTPRLEAVLHALGHEVEIRVA